MVEGRIAFLMSDIEGSTRLAQLLGPAWPSVLARHRDILRDAITRHNGVVVDMHGDSSFAVFANASDAASAAVDIQRGMSELELPPDANLSVRIGLHVGHAAQVGDTYVGVDVHATSRITDVAHGGQVVVSDTVDVTDFAVRDLGRHRLKDLGAAIRLQQICGDGLRQDFPPLRSLGAPSNLPASVSSFIGRHDELATICKHIKEGRRLISLTGPGGTGKTRLSIQVAREWLDRFIDGVWFVEFGAVTDPSNVWTAVSEAIGIADGNDQTTSEAICEFLEDRQALIVLDNCEHLIDAIARVADELLRRCPQLHLVATTREPLRIGGEVRVAVPPLNCPVTDEEGVEVLAGYDAVRVFVERAKEVASDFSITPQNAASIARICRRVDGLPLAIELAAARVGAMSTDTIADQLDDRFALLDQGSRTAPERHQSLEATIAWSYRLLEEDDRCAFDAVGLFPGGATPQAIASVTTLSEATASSVLQRLTLRSLLNRVSDEPRFLASESMRAFAVAQLEARGEMEAAMLAVTRWIADRTAILGPQILNRRTNETLIQLASEQDNVRAVLEFASLADPELYVTITLNMAEFWCTKCLFSEGRRWLERAIEMSGPSIERGHALVMATKIAGRQTDYEEVFRLGERALSEPITTDMRARVASDVGFAELQRGNLPEAEDLFRQTLKTARSTSDTQTMAPMLVNLSIATRKRGDLAESMTAATEAIEHAREVGDYVLVTALDAAAAAAHFSGKHADAKRYLAEYVEVADRLDDPGLRAYGLDHLGIVALEDGNPDEARRCHLTSLPLHIHAQDRRGAASALSALGSVARFEGNLTEAFDLKRECLRQRWDLGLVSALPPSLRGIAEVVEQIGNTRRASVLRGAADSIAERHGARRTAPEKDLDAWESGRAMSTADAIAYALDDPSD